jgi:chromosome segregation ATPase
MGENNSSGSNGSAMLAKLLNQLNIPTLAVILLTGGGNLLATHKLSDEQKLEIKAALRQVHDLHEALDETEKRQRTALDNQRQLLEHDSVLLKEVHDIAIRLNQLRDLDQMRGAHP